MTDAEAMEMIAKLEKHFGFPVWPLPKVCHSFFTWMVCVRAANVEDQKSGMKLSHGSSYSMHFER